MRTTMRDIAMKCGVTTATVSLALSGKEGRVSQQVRQKIIQTARDMHYYPNMMASNLAKGRSQTVGLVVNDLRNAHIASLFMSISTALQAQGYSPVCHVLCGDEEHYEELVRQIATENLCALIWAKPYEPGKTEENETLYSIIDPLGIPVFTMDDYGFKSPGINICYDYYNAGRMAVRYLTGRGHRRIGLIAGNQSFKVTEDRERGYRDALEEAGISFDEKLVYRGDYTMQSGGEALPYLLGQGVSAIFAMNDEMALGVYRQARSYGVRIPDMLSVIGCDNVPYDDILEVPLSTVGVPADQMGAFIGEKVCGLIRETSDTDGQPDHLTRQTVYYKPDLYLRGSVAAYIR